MGEAGTERLALYGRQLGGGHFYDLLPFGTGGFFYLNVFPVRVQCPMSALLSGRQFDAVGGFFHSLVEVRLRHKGRVAYQSVVAFHFPYVFHGEGEGGVVAFVIIKVVVRRERRTVFALQQFRFLDLSHALSRSVGQFSGEFLQRTEHIATTEEMCRVQSLLVQNGDSAGFPLDGLGHRFADHFRLRFYDDRVGVVGDALCMDRQEEKAQASAEQYEEPDSRMVDHRILLLLYSLFNSMPAGSRL